MLGIFRTTTAPPLPVEGTAMAHGLRRRRLCARGNDAEVQALAYNSLQPFSVNAYKDRYLTVRHTLILKSQS